MATDSMYYRHSGHIGLVGPLLIIVAGVVTSAVLGAVYGYLIFYNPFVYINFIATLIFGGLCGASVSVAAKIAKVRNDLFVLLSGLAVGVLCLYSGWVFWIHALSEQEYFLATDPESVFIIIGNVAETGVWSIFGWAPKGGALYTIWVIEAVMIVGAAVVGSYYFIGESENTFCDSCKKWTEDVYTSLLLAPIEDPFEFTERLEQADYKPLMGLKIAEAANAPGVYTRLVVQGCRTCWDFFCLDAKLAALSQSDKGEVEEEEALLIDNLLIGVDLHDKIKKRYGEK